MKNTFEMQSTLYLIFCKPQAFLNMLIINRLYCSCQSMMKNRIIHHISWYKLLCKIWLIIQ